ncbi:S-layer protein, partial [filamentous cyanobacterium CCP3]
MVSGLSLLLVTGCAGSSLQQSLEADPQLQDRPVFSEDSPESTTTSETADSAEESDPIASTPSTSDTEATSSTPRASTTARLEEVPDDLRSYVQDWLALGIVADGQSSSDSRSDPSRNRPSAIEFEPNQPITRGEFAHWLLTANNELYADVPAKRIRPATASTTPTFQDVPASHPYFADIQGLAEAGII